MVTIELQNAAPHANVPARSQFECWAQAIRSAEDRPQEVAVRIVDEEEMTRLNQHYRHKAGPTNVLSFPAELPADIDLPFLGDVVICAPVVIDQARQQGKPEQSHWAHMIVHGILHLQGYDHINEADARQMESLEIQIMQQLGFENPYD